VHFNTTEIKNVGEIYHPSMIEPSLSVSEHRRAKQTKRWGQSAILHEPELQALTSVLPIASTSKAWSRPLPIPDRQVLVATRELRLTGATGSNPARMALGTLCLRHTGWLGSALG
jgi:hypothetical protein